MSNIDLYQLQENYQKNVAQRILSEVMDYRRFARTSKVCSQATCAKCENAHLPKILRSIEKNEPITFVLPAFPGKSPNRDKVLGVLPDKAERLSLIFLESLCEKVREYYTPGMKIIICSDGRVFSDVVGMREEDVTAYQVAIDKLIKDLALQDISTFNLDDIYKGEDFELVRMGLMNKFGHSLDSLKEKIRNGKNSDASNEEVDANRMYRGITRFLFEDSLHPDQTMSRSALQRDARERAYEVIRRSNAWSRLIAKYFSGAVRLSIHPQACGSEKLGIRLISNESWMTPWHGVAVETDAGFKLLKRTEAVDLGGTLIHDASGAPSHFSMIAEESDDTSMEEAYV